MNKGYILVARRHPMSGSGPDFNIAFSFSKEKLEIVFKEKVIELNAWNLVIEEIDIV